MDDPLDVIDRLLDLLDAREIGGDEGLVVAEIGRPLDVAETQLGIDRLQQLAQAAADVAGRTRQQHAFHVSLSVLHLPAIMRAAQMVGGWRSANRR
jgi:hypothetical protein